MKKEHFENLTSLTCREFNPDETVLILRRNMWGYLSWGVSKLMCYPNVNSCTGLFLKVNGHHHKGWVFITLSFLDLFDVHILNNQYRVLETIEGIYNEDLFDTIDKRIERIPEYVR